MDQGVGQEIKRLREERNWSQAKLAVEAEMSVSGVSMIENGQRNLTTTTLAKLARAFGVEIGDLFPKEQAPLPDLEDERRSSLQSLATLVNRLAVRWEREVQRREEEWKSATPSIRKNVKRLPNLTWANEIRGTAGDVMDVATDELEAALGIATSREALDLFVAIKRLDKVIARTDPWYSSDASEAGAAPVINFREAVNRIGRRIEPQAS